MKLGKGRNQIRSFFEDCVLPFGMGFAWICVILWVREYFNYDYRDEPPPDIDPVLSSSTPTNFVKKNGQLYLERDGIQYFIPNESKLFSIQAPASEGFEVMYESWSNVTSDNDPEPPGTIWPWPRVEEEAPSRPLVWVVTPTYRNPYQHAELTRIAQSMYPARRFVRWLVVDDLKHSRKYENHISNLRTFLFQFKINFTILVSKPKPKNERILFRPKGVEARRTALAHIRKRKLNGVVYFADDDNTYDSDIFRQMQSTKTVSIWPTGAITEWTISSPVVDEQGKVVDFFDAWVANRKFPCDFASFAVNTDLIHNDPEVNIPWVQGYEETKFLDTLKIDKSEFQPLSANATQVLTWHTKTLKPPTKIYEVIRKSWPVSVRILLKKYDFLFESGGTERRRTKVWKYKNRTANVIRTRWPTLAEI